MIQVYNPAEYPLAEEIHNAPDRICAVLAVAFLEEKLTAAVKSRLLKDDDTLKKLFKPSGPLGPYATKTELAYLLKLFSMQTRNDLLVLGEIRNSFAHWTKLIDFGSRDIRPKCEALTLYTRVFGHKDDRKKPFDRRMARDEFIETVSIAANLCHSVVATPNHPNYW
jgi:hypothetical protein